MYDILHEVNIAEAPDKVYEAITESKGLEAWWAPQALAEPRVGSTVQARFADGHFVITMDVAALEPTRKVEWIIQEGLAEWQGTHVTWDLVPAVVGKGTKVLFGHRGFASTDGPLPAASYDWAFYLTSLVEYLETGKGTPGGLDARFAQFNS